MYHSIEALVSTLKAARLAKGLSQRRLAKKLGIPQSHLSKIENAKVNITSVNLLEIARTLDLEVMLVPIKNVRAIENIIASTSLAKKPEIRPAYLPDDFEGEEDG